MSSSQDLVFIETIPDTTEYAEAVQKLTLQDLLLGGFSNPRITADPTNGMLVENQKQKLHKYPERYSGFVRGDTLVAFMKQKVWTSADEAPFAPKKKLVTKPAAIAVAKPVAAALKVTRKASEALRPDHSLVGQWGVFALVASDELMVGERDMILDALLRRSFRDLVNGQRRTVNIPIHKNDPLLEIAKRHGFVAVGKVAEADGAPGLKQHRYQRQASK